jgi:hypothetical protein
MINDNAIYLQMMIVAIGVIVIMASIGIPIYAYSRKRWKGLAIGCLLQPIACAVVICLIVLGIISYFKYTNRKEMDSAMVTVRGLDVGNHSKDTLTWYLKDDEQCILVCNNQNDYDHLRFSDVIRLDSVSVTVDDRIVVRFDTKKNKVVATDLDTPMEVVNVNWDKVRAYFGK